MNKYREDFPVLKKPVIYFDSAATAQKPQVVIDTIRDFYENNYGTVHRAIYDLSTFATTEYEKTRKKAQNFLGAEHPEEIIYTKGTTEAINLVAATFIQEGDEVIISEVEHHANIVPWQLRKANLKIIPVNDAGKLDLDQLKSIISPKTKLVSVAHISNVLGTINPIAEIAEVAHQNGARLFVDGAQGAAHLPVNVQELGADFYAFSGHKLYGPTGIGILYGKKEILETLPPYQSGGDMIETVTLEKTTFNDLPLKFEAGTPAIAEVIALGAAIDYVQNIGMQNIHNHGQELLSYALEKLNSIEGLQLIGTATSKAPVISFNIDGIHPLDLGTLLNLKGIAIRTGHHCSQPAMKRFGISACARASLGLYNTKEEVDRFTEALHSTIPCLQK